MYLFKEQIEHEQFELEGKNVMSDIMVPLWNLQTDCAITKQRIDNLKKTTT